MENNHGSILIADIDEASRTSFHTFLSNQRYKVETAQSGSEVIQKVQNMGIDIAIMDVELRGMKGYEVIPILKEIDPELPIIMTSSDDSIELARKIRENEVFFYEIKPVDFEEIQLAIKDALKKRGNR